MLHAAHVFGASPDCYVWCESSVRTLSGVPAAGAADATNAHTTDKRIIERGWWRDRRHIHVKGRKVFNHGPPDRNCKAHTQTTSVLLNTTPQLKVMHGMLAGARRRHAVSC
jgi:hypothetical protein